MKALLYETIVYEGSIAHLHNIGSKIWEVWIPEYDICINKKGGVFISKEARKHSSDVEIEIDISKNSCELFQSHLNIQEIVSKELKNIFEKLKNIGLAAEPGPSGLVRE